MLRDALFILAIGILAVVAWLWIPQLMIKRNARKVIRIFQENNAIGIENAKTVEELGIERYPMLKTFQPEKLFGRRDWKPAAMDFLIQSNVILVTEDGKLYITEASIADIPWLDSKK